ncbi:MAG: YigZ family protein [Myxococcota bacterium]
MRYLTVAVRSEYVAEPVKGSRFIAVVLPAVHEAAAMAEIRAIEAANPDVDHCCWAWRLRDGSSRTWDAAEPRGSAGRPILAQLEGHAVFDAAVVVLRHFGGTKLGVGGLVRAYGGTAGMALDRATLREVADTVELHLTHGYADTNAVEAAITAAGASVVSTSWDAEVKRVIRVDAELADGWIGELRDRTAGRVVAERE